MKITLKIYQQYVRGYALLMTMIFISIALLLLVSVMNWSNSSARQTERNNLFGLGTGAAEAATELVIAQMTFDFFQSQFASNTNYYMTNNTCLPPSTTGWPVQFLFSNPMNNKSQSYESVNPINWTTNWGTLFAANFAGMHAYIANCTVISTATASNQPYSVSATVKQTFELASIPLPQFAIFYNLNMEIDPGATMTVTGPVFSNGSIWSRGPNTFYSSVAAVGVVSTNSADPWLLTKTDSNQAAFNQGYSSNADTLAMPIGQTNDPAAVRALLNLPPAGTAPYSSTGQLYFINQTDLIVSNSPGGTLSAYLQDSNNATPVQYITPDVTQSITNLLNSYTTNTSKTITTNWNAGHTKITGYTTNTVTTVTTNTTATITTTNFYSFATNITFYDYREGKTVAAVQLNVNALTNWLVSSNGSTFNTQVHNDTGHYIDSVYVYNNAPYTSTSLPSVRVANGSVLPDQGLTVITPDPLYVLGNFNATGAALGTTNTANTQPAFLMGDSITALSTSWSDSWNSGTALSSRNPGSTTINAAMLEGIVPTVGANYSGGVENFIRLLENWGTSTPLTYNGSIIVMFPSQYATNRWQQTGVYYNAPKRNWAFDLNFTSNNGLPPLTPRVTKIFRQTWSVY